MHFKGFCLLRFDIQNITIKPSAGGCLFDAALTVLKTLISQPSLHLLLLYTAGLVAWQPCLAWGPGLPCRDPPCPVPPSSCRTEWKRIREKRVWKWCLGGSVVRVPVAARGFGGLGYQAASPLCCWGPLSYGQGGGPRWAPLRSLPGSSSWLCGSLTGATPCPSPLGWGQSLWSLAQCGWRGSNAVPGTDGDDCPLLEGSPSATRAWVLPLGVAQQFQGGWGALAHGARVD